MDNIFNLLLVILVLFLVAKGCKSCGSKPESQGSKIEIVEKEILELKNEAIGCKDEWYDDERSELNKEIGKKYFVVLKDFLKDIKLKVIDLSHRIVGFYECAVEGCDK